MLKAVHLVWCYNRNSKSSLGLCRTKATPQKWMFCMIATYTCTCERLCLREQRNSHWCKRLLTVLFCTALNAFNSISGYQASFKSQLCALSWLQPSGYRNSVTNLSLPVSKAPLLGRERMTGVMLRAVSLIISIWFLKRRQVFKCILLISMSVPLTSDIN